MGEHIRALERHVFLLYQFRIHVCLREIKWEDTTDCVVHISAVASPRRPLSSLPQKNNRTRENRILVKSFPPINVLAHTEEIGGLLSFTYVRKVHKTLKASNRKAIPEKCLNGKTIEFPHLSVSTFPSDLLSNIFAFYGALLKLKIQTMAHFNVRRRHDKKPNFHEIHSSL